MVERCRNMDAVLVENSMFLHRPIPISWSILRQSPNFLVSVHVYRTILDLVTHTNHHPLPKAGCEQKLIHKKVGCEVILSANRPNSRYQTPPIQLHTSGVVKRSHGCGTLPVFSTTSMFVQRSTILIYIHPELL